LIKWGKMKKILVIFLATTLVYSAAPAHAQDSITKETVAVVGSVETPVGVIDVWKADLPTRVWMERRSDGPCGYINFSIEALLPYSQLDNINGPEVDFEIWSSTGEKIGDRSIYRFSWNPVGPLTAVKIFNCGREGYGNFVLIAKTQYQVSTTGLISRYFESSIRHNITVSPAPKPPAAMKFSSQGRFTKGVLEFSYRKPNSGSKILSYEVGYSTSKSSSNRSPRFSKIRVLKQVDANEKSFEINKADVRRAYSSGVNFVSFSVRAVSEAGPGKWSKGWYYSKSQARSITK
jgi:hypothetical protein